MGGGGDSGAATAGAQMQQRSLEQLLQDMQRQQKWEQVGQQVGQGFKQLGAGLGQQTPLPQLGGRGQPAYQAPAIGAQPDQGAYLSQLFPQQGMDAQQFAEILRRLAGGGGVGGPTYIQ